MARTAERHPEAAGIQHRPAESSPTSLYVTKRDAELPPRFLETSEDLGQERPVTIFEMFKAAAQVHGQRNALAYKRPSEGASLKDTEWTYITWADYYDKALQFGRALLKHGFQEHSVINILGFNTHEWFISYMGAILAGGISAGIYATNGPDACHYVTKDSEAEVVVVDSVAQLKKYKDATAEKLPSLKALVLYGDRVPEDFRVANPEVKVYTFDEFMEQGAEVPADDVIKRSLDIKPGHCASIIYTSGTTGPPKGAMLSHDNLTWTASQAEHYFPNRQPDEAQISYLPLSHVAGQVLDMVLPITFGGCVYFAQPDALKGSLVETLRDVRPTFFFGVPRVWEKFYEQLQKIHDKTPRAARVVTDFLKKKERKHKLSTQHGEDYVEPWGLWPAELMTDQVRQKMGLDRAEYCVSGAAPLDREVAEYFAGLGIIIYEAFGMSESTGLGLVNGPKGWKLGTVGRPCPGEEIRLDEKSGELQMRGRHVFMGYLNMEDKSKDTVLEGGWLRTDDLASIDEDNDALVPPPSGFVSITGRIKELIITAGGENVSPGHIEQEIKSACPAVASAMAVGDRRKYLVVLLTMHTDDKGNLKGASKAEGEAIGASANTPQEAAEDQKWKEYFDSGLKEANKNATSRAQNVQKWALLDQDFSEANGELTPTLKMKRSVIQEKYKDVIEKLYGDSGSSKGKGE